MKNGASSSICTSSSMRSNQMNWAMRLSFCTGILLLILKLYAYSITGSSAILSDCSESVIHIFAVGFATFSMWLSLQPADIKHQYGHDKISFFSAGFEGAMIVIAALYIIYESTIKLLYGCDIINLTQGISFIFAATAINGLLGGWLLLKGNQHSSLILKANGRHLLTDCVTSLCVVIGLIAVQITQIIWIDPLIALGAAIHILISGSKLVTESIEGLMDSTDVELDKEIKKIISNFSEKHQLSYHKLRHRKAGALLFIEFHLLFPDMISLFSAHEIATELEAILKSEIAMPLDIITHLEPKEQHDIVHKKFSLESISSL